MATSIVRYMSVQDVGEDQGGRSVACRVCVSWRGDGESARASIHQ